MQRVQDRERRAREALSRFGIEVPGEVWHPAAATRAADSRAIAPTEPIHGIDPHNHLQEHDIQVPAGTAAGGWEASSSHHFAGCTAGLPSSGNDEGENATAA